MKIRTTVSALGIALALAGSAGTAMACSAHDSIAAAEAEAKVRARLSSEGYTDIKDVEVKNGAWTAEAVGADGQHVEVRIDPATAKLIPEAAH